MEIYFKKPKDWKENIFMYRWQEGQDNQVDEPDGPWPGKKMSHHEGRWFFLEVDSPKEAINLKFSDGENETRDFIGWGMEKGWFTLTEAFPYDIERFKYTMFPTRGTLAVIIMLRGGSIHDFNAMNMLKDHGIKATAFIDPRLANYEDRVNLDDLKGTYEGYEIGMQVSHLADLDTTEAEHALRDEILRGLRTLKKYTNGSIRGVTYGNKGYFKIINQLLPIWKYWYGSLSNEFSGTMNPPDSLTMFRASTNLNGANTMFDQLMEMDECGLRLLSVSLDSTSCGSRTDWSEFESLLNKITEAKRQTIGKKSLLWNPTLADYVKWHKMMFL